MAPGREPADSARSERPDRPEDHERLDRQALERMAEAAASCPVLTRLFRLVDWVGAGRRPTGSGELSSGDVRAASVRLGVERHEVEEAWQLARRLKLVEVMDGVAYQGAEYVAWDAFEPRDRLALWRDAFAYTLGVVPDAQALLNLRDGLPVVLALNALYEGNTPPTPAWLGAMLAHVLPDGGPRLGFEYPVDTGLGDYVVGVLVDFAVAALEDGQVVLTPQGRWLVGELGPDLGYRDPSVVARQVAWREREKNPTLRWIETHTPYEVAVEFLARAAAHDAYKRIAALQVVQSVGPVGKRAWEAYAGLPPPVGPHARAWLAAHGEPVTLTELDQAWIAADRFVAELCTVEQDDGAGEDLLRRIPPAELARIKSQFDAVTHPDGEMIRRILAAYENR